MTPIHEDGRQGQDMGEFPEWRPIFEARRHPNNPCVWDVWDIEHPAECNHFPLVRVDSKGAADDLHECIAKMIADCMNTRWAAEANRARREEALARIEAFGHDPAEGRDREATKAGIAPDHTPPPSNKELEQ